MAHVIAGIIAVKEGKILMVQEKQPSCLGKWNFPLGKLEDTESIIDCALREGKEETGYDFKILCLVGVYQQFSFSGGNGRGNRIGFVFLAEVIGGEKFLTEEILDIRWLSFSEIKELDKKGQLRASYVMQAINGFQNHHRFPLSCITVL